MAAPVRKRRKPSAPPPGAAPDSSRRRRDWLVGLLIAILCAALLLGREQLAAWPNTLARRALENQRYAEAQSRLQWSLRIDGQNADAHLMLARALRKQGRFPAAEQSLRRAMEMFPQDARFGAESTLLPAHRGVPTMPLREALTAAAEELPETCEAYVAGMLRENHLDDAHRLLAAWEQEFPHDPQAHYYRGELLVKQRWLQEAEIKFRKVLELAPEHPFAALALADLLLEQHQIEEALRLYARAAEATDTRTAGKIGQAKCWRTLDRPERARQVLESCLTEEPESATALVELGRLEIAAANYEAGLEHLQTADRIAPHSPGLKQHLAAALSAVGKKEQAARIYEQLQANLPGDAVVE